MENNKKPSIRFTGFTDAWEQRKLLDTYSFSQGLQVPVDEQYYEKEDDKERFIRIVDVTQSEEIQRYIRNETGKGHVEPNDIFFVRYGAVGTIGHGYKGTIANNLFKLNPKEEHDHNFMYHQFADSDFNRQLKGLTASTSMPAINFVALINMNIWVTSLKEERTIGTFFHNLDSLITLHQRKLDKLQNIKKSMLEKMFPKNGSDVPEIRFEGFTDAWELRKLGNVANYRNGKAHEGDISEQGEYAVVNSKFVSTNGHIRKYSNRQIEPLLKNEIAFVLSDVPNGRALARTFFVDKDNEYTLNQRIAGITPTKNTIPYYLYILLDRNEYFLRYDDGVKQTNLSITDVMKFEAYYPSIEEQSRIGSLFENIDSLVKLHQSKLEKLQNIKKSMLEKMFV